MRTKPELLPLTGLRFWLALWVVIYHQSPGLVSTYVIPWEAFNVLRTGHLAVGIFFVLSGFILAYNYDLANWSRTLTAKFALARFARIYPVYFFSILVLAPFWIKAALHAPWKELGSGILHFGLLQAWIPAASDLWYWNTPGWSVSNEAFFYVLFPFIGMAIWKRACTRGMSACLLGLCWIAAMALPLLVVVASLPGCRIVATDEGHHSSLLNLIRFIPLFRLPEFLSGIVACKLYSHFKISWEGKGYWLYLPAISIVLVTIEMTAATLPYLVLTNGLLLPATAIFLVGLALGGGPLARLLSQRSMVFLGGASYSMYLLHAPIRLWITKWQILHLSNLEGTTVYVCVVIAAATVVFRYIEEPANRMIRRVFSTKSPSASKITISLSAKQAQAALVDT